MNNEKSVYERILEDKDKIINMQNNLINKLIKTNVITILILAVVMIVFTLSYFWSDYTDCKTNTITGDNNISTEISDNKMETSSLELDN